MPVKAKPKTQMIRRLIIYNMVLLKHIGHLTWLHGIVPTSTIPTMDDMITTNPNTKCLNPNAIKLGA